MIVNLADGNMKVVHSRLIARHLLDIGAVKFNTDSLFTWTSDIQSPIYCDNRIINSIVPVRDAVVDEFSNTIALNYPTLPAIIAGVATGGMTYGVIVATRLSLPFIYVRPERKEHGLKKVVEGHFERGDKVIVIEDHISTGKSSIKAVEHLREEGLEVLSLLSILTYGFKEADQAFKEKKIEFGSLCTLDIILDVALETGKLTQAQVDTILEFRASPKTWGPNKGKFS
jgi:orotate phosphoribosyltransferase